MAEVGECLLHLQVAWRSGDGVMDVGSNGVLDVDGRCERELYLV
jgi:hypothetical protein